MIRLRGVGHVHAAGSPWAHRALHGVDLDLESGERIAIVGRNGAGKSTLAMVIAGALHPTEGTAELDGEPLVECRDRLGLVVQHARLQLLRPSVREELAVGGAPVAAEALLDRLGAAHLVHREVDALSGGEQRIVALASVFAPEPEVVVLDEPFAGLDAVASERLVALLGSVRSSVVIVTHDLAPTAPVRPRVVEIVDGTVPARVEDR
ncbi:MAG: ABC transporter ATP-binding protein [Actinomycetota bacterium]